MTTLTLTPYLGRDYKSKAEVLDALENGHDFTVADMSSRWNGKPVNTLNLEQAGVTHARVRYNRLRKVCIIDITTLGRTK